MEAGAPMTASAIMQRLHKAKKEARRCSLGSTPVATAVADEVTRKVTRRKCRPPLDSAGRQKTKNQRKTAPKRGYVIAPDGAGCLIGRGERI